MPRLEIAATTLEDAINAQVGGADSIEISYDLSVGGLTPTFDLVRSIRDVVQIDVQVIVRPHARDFCYTPGEIAKIIADTRTLAKMPIQGIVLGAIDETGQLNIPLIRRVAEVAAPMPVTVHRALDVSNKPDDALHQLIGIVPRILTSGPAPTAWEGRDTLRRWVQEFGGHFSFVPSGGLTMAQFSEFVAHVQAPEYHLGSAARSSGMVDVEKVRRLKQLLQA
jgi:copper homeostasis protein